jgi:hypothetical protein
VTGLTNGLAPTVATVTSTVDKVASPVLDIVNGAVSPVTESLLGQGGVLAPVTGVVGNLLGGLPSSGPGSATYAGPAVAANIGGNAVTGASTADTLIGANVLSAGSEANAVHGQLATVDLLTENKVVDITVPTTPAAVAAGLKPVGNLAGAVLGPQIGGSVTQVTDGVAPVVAVVTSTVDTLTAPVLEIVNSTVPNLAGGPSEGGNLLAPVTNLVGSLTGGSADGGLLAPVTNLVGSVTGGVGGGELLAPVTGLVNSLTGGEGSAGSVLAPVTNLVGSLTGGGASDGAGGVLAPVTNVVNSVLGTVTTGTSNGQGGLLAPVTGLLGIK